MDGLRRLDGVDSVKVDLKSGRVTIQPEPRIEIELAAVPRQVHASGFVAGPMQIQAEGTLEPAAPGPALRIRNWRRTYPVRAAAGGSAPSGGTYLVELDGDNCFLRPIARLEL